MKYVCLFVVLAAVIAQAEIVEIQPGLIKGKDAYCWEELPNNNYGPVPILKVYSHQSPSGAFVGFIEFDDLMYYEGEVLNQAVLWLNTQAATGAGGDLEFGACDAYWSEDTVTWFTMPDIHPQTKGSADFPSDSGDWWSADVTDIVQAWLDTTLANHGFKLFDEDTGDHGASFWASEYASDPTLRPKLVLYISEADVEEVSFGQIKAMF